MQAALTRILAATTLSERADAEDGMAQLIRAQYQGRAHPHTNQPFDARTDSVLESEWR